MSNLMKAITSRTYGGPEVMKLETIERPVPKPNQVLVKVMGSSVNPADWHMLRGTPFFIRLAESGLFKPKNPVLGADIAGVIEEVGSNVKANQVGDEVFGDLGTSAYAEYAVADINQIAPKPKEISFAEAGVVGIAGITALQAVRDWGQVKAGQKVLVNGASGGVGTYAVQIAKSLGAEVTGVCSTANVQLVRDLGADRVIDYKKTDFVEEARTYDVIIDVAANRSISDIKKAMSPKSVWVLVGYNLKNMLFIGLFSRWLFSEMAKSATVNVAKVSTADLKVLGDMLSSGEVRSVIDRQYELQDTPIAVEYVETSRAKGKVAIRVC